MSHDTTSNTEQLLLETIMPYWHCTDEPVAIVPMVIARWRHLTTSVAAGWRHLTTSVAAGERCAGGRSEPPSPREPLECIVRPTWRCLRKQPRTGLMYNIHTFNHSNESTTSEVGKSTTALPSRTLCCFQQFDGFLVWFPLNTLKQGRRSLPITWGILIVSDVWSSSVVVLPSVWFALRRCNLVNGQSEQLFR